MTKTDILNAFREDEDFKALFFGENKSLYFTKKKFEQWLLTTLTEFEREAEANGYAEGRESICPCKLSKSNDGRAGTSPDCPLHYITIEITNPKLEKEKQERIA